jgi:uncharacterized protein YndB with AHSA1/START domain
MSDHLATGVVAADPDEVFRLITTPERLTVNAQWVVTVTALGQSWPSRSTVLELDPSSRRFAYPSQSDDGNPSYADWSWQVTDAPGGCRVTVSLALHPVRFWRRVLLARIRARQLQRRELPASLAALASRMAAPNKP